MAESNPMRWVVLSLVAAGLFAGGLYLFIQSKVEGARAQAEAEARAMTERMEQRDRQVTAEIDVARSVASAFVAHIGAGRFAEAHALLATPYRDATSVAAFAASCRASPILAGARAVTFQDVRQMRVGSVSAIEARGLLEAAAGGVPVTFTFLHEPTGPRVLAVVLAGVPVLQGITARSRPPG
jgi:phosphate/sulfate permease